MQDISKINELLKVDSSIVKERKNYLLPVLIILAGIFIVAYSYNSHFPLILDSVITIITLIGIVIFLTGIIFISIPSKKLIYSGTREKIKKQILYFDQQKENDVIEKLREGNFDILKEIASDYDDGPLRAVIYLTKSGNFAVVQLQKYIPFQYEPIMEPYVSKK